MAEFKFTSTESTSRSQTQTFTVPDLVSVNSVKVDSGKVVVSNVSGNKVTLKMTEGPVSKSVVVSGEYIPAKTKTVTGQTSANYSDSQGYKGTLTKYLYSGSYTPSDTKYVSGQSSQYYDSGGYTGTLERYLASGSYTPSDTKFVTNQTISTYNANGYSGNLSRYLHSGKLEPEKTKTVTGQTSANYSDSEGYKGTLTKYLYSGSYTPSDSKTVTIRRNQTFSWEVNSNSKCTLISKNIPNYETIQYNSEGYSGTLYVDKSTAEYVTADLPRNLSFYLSRLKRVEAANVGDKVSIGGDGCVGSRNVTISYEYTGTVTKPEVDTRVYRYQGTVTKPESDTRVYRYQGNVTKPASDTRVYKYRGNVTKPASDTRVYRYKGEVTKPAVDTRKYQDYYKYTGTINYATVDDMISLVNVTPSKDISNGKLLIDVKVRGEEGIDLVQASRFSITFFNTSKGNYNRFLGHIKVKPGVNIIDISDNLKLFKPNEKFKVSIALKESSKTLSSITITDLFYRNSTFVKIKDKWCSATPFVKIKGKWVEVKEALIKKSGNWKK